jgi:hypothetical protein
VTHDGGAGRDGGEQRVARIQALGDRHRERALRHVEPEGRGPRPPAGAAQHVRRAHVAAAHAAYVGDAEGTRHEEAERDRPDQVGRGDHDER